MDMGTLTAAAAACARLWAPWPGAKDPKFGASLDG